MSNSKEDNRYIEKVRKVAVRLIELINNFEPVKTHSDKEWQFYLKVKRKWVVLDVKEYNGVYYFFSSEFKEINFALKTKELNGVVDLYSLYKLLPSIVEALEQAFNDIKGDRIGFLSSVERKMSPTMRYGVMHRSIVRELLPNWMRFDLDLGASNVQAMIKLLEKSDYNNALSSMTSEKYFEYCKIAYLANSKHSMKGVNKSSSGRDLYIKYADGRDEGLTDLDIDSEEAFSRWYHNRSRIGGHPWEIYRGGNTTHIDLSLTNENDKWVVRLTAYSSTRLAETCRIALALDKAGLPFKIDYKESYQKRLLCDDFIGIVPEYDSLHRGWQSFPSDFNIADCIQFSWFRDDEKGWLAKPKELAALVYWLPQRPLIAKTKLSVMPRDKE